MKTNNKIWIFSLMAMSILLGIFISCKKANNKIPELTTASISSITQTMANSGGTITSDGGESVTAYGICWSTSQNPTLADNKTSDGSGTGSFTSSIHGLSPATTYYVRAYATNSAGTGYGNSQTFTTLALEPGTVVDFDGNIYHTITIGSHQWFVENLKVTHYRNGDPINPGKSMKQLKNSEADGEYWNYGNNDSLGNIYGRLYNYYAVIDSRFIAPLGWHVASNNDLIELENSLGADSSSGGKMKEAGTLHWHNPNIGATNETGFTALPAGNYNSATGFFSFLGYGTTIWTSTPHGSDEAYVFAMYNNTAALTVGYSIPNFGGASVRCVSGN